MSAGSNLDPDSLNNWLTATSSGYTWDGGFNWFEIPSLSGELKATKNSTELKYYKLRGDSIFPSVDNVLSSGLSAILGISDHSSPSGSHYVVATGIKKSGEQYTILDPLSTSRTVLDTNDATIKWVNVYEPTNSNLSYLVIHLSPGLQGLLTHGSGAKVGLDGSEHTDQPKSWYGWIPPLVFDDTKMSSGNGFTELGVPTPLEGDYNLRLSTTNPGVYKLAFYFYDHDGESEKYEYDVFVGSSGTEYNFNYHQSEENWQDPTLIVSFDSLIAKIRYAYDQGWIIKSYNRDKFIREVKEAQQYAQKRPVKAIRYLETLKQMLRIYKPIRLTQVGYDFLIGDIGTLIEDLR